MIMDQTIDLEGSVGIKYRLLSTNRIRGVLKRSPEDFIVREILPDGSVIFDGSEIGSDSGGLYTHFILWKRGLDTHSAIKKIARYCHLEENDFSFAGLKDAQAVSFQRVSIWGLHDNCLKNIRIPDIKILNPIRQKFAVPLGDLAGNQFHITIRDVLDKFRNDQCVQFSKEATEKGFLNYFGLQRFGSKRPILHIVGKNLLLKNYSEALETYIGWVSPFENEKITLLRQRFSEDENPRHILKEFPKSYSFERTILNGLIQRKSPEKIALSLSQYFLKLAVSAYQSYVFNIILQHLTKENYKLTSETKLPLIGYQTKISELDKDIKFLLEDQLTKDEITTTSFNHSHKVIRSRGFTRKGIEFPTHLTLNCLKSENDKLELQFNLTKGSYATMFLRELLEDKPLQRINYSG